MSTLSVEIKKRMSQVAVEAPPKGGFSFDLCRRNGMLSKKGVPPPSYRKTGTTIVGLIFQVTLFISICLLFYMSFFRFSLIVSLFLGVNYT